MRRETNARGRTDGSCLVHAHDAGGQVVQRALGVGVTAIPRHLALIRKLTREKSGGRRRKSKGGKRGRGERGVRGGERWREGREERGLVQFMKS